MVESEATEGSAARKLLPEHWELVAIKLPAKEWAKVRGTCKAMHKAKRRSLQLDPVSTQELVRTVKAVPDAEKLWLDITKLSFGVCSASYFRKVWEEHDAKLQHLQQLSLIMSGKTSSTSKRQEAITQWLTAIAAVLATAQDLVTLRLNLPDVPTLPLMTKLEHVNLITCQPLTQETCKWLQSLPSLQTLSIEQSPDAASETAFVVPRLDLSPCKHLKSVSLFHTVPKEFSVPALCSVTLWTDSQTLRPKWTDVYSSSCTACSVFVAAADSAFFVLSRAFYRPSPERVSHNYFVDMFAAAPAANLTMLRIELLHDQLGNLMQPLELGENLPNLRSFSGRGRDIFLRFGSMLKLESLRCDAEFALHFDVALGTRETFLALRHMHVFWGHSAHGFRMHSLMRAFRKAGYKCDVHALDNGVFEATYCAAGYTPADEEKLCLGCGACGMCLTEKHGITDLFGPPACTRSRSIST
ncbi:g6074 [Coccomyxa elongata]